MINMEFTGSFSFLFIFQIPIINYMMHLNPNLKIHMTGLVGEDYYYKNEHGLPLLHDYTGVEPNPNIRRELDKYLPLFRTFPRRYTRTGLIAQNSDIGNHVIFCSRYHQVYKDLDPNGPRHANSDYECDHLYLQLLSKEVKVYITGLPGECYEFDDIENVESLVNLSPQDKPRILLDLTNSARGLISTAASAIGTYGMCVGTPTICFNTHRYHLTYGAQDGSVRNSALNPFGTYIQSYEQIAPDPKLRFEETMKFLDAASNTHRYERDILIEEKNLEWRW